MPYAKRLPRAVVEKLYDFALKGLPVWCIDGKPEATCEGDLIPADMLAQFQVIALEKLPIAMRYQGFEDVTALGENTEHLRVYHYSRGGGHALMLTNEGIHSDVKAKLSVRDFSGGEFVRYDAMENNAVRDCAEKEIELCIPPYGSELIFFGDIETKNIPEKTEKVWKKLPLEELSWQVSFAGVDDYQPGEECPAAFGEEEQVAKLYNIVRKKKQFAGFVRYETELTIPGTGSEEETFRLDLGRVGEVAEVWLDGKKLGQRIIPPYRFEFAAKPGTQLKLCVVTTSHLGYAQQDGFSAYLGFDPVGLLGPVALEG
jgi:hypothetical protein